MTSNLPIINRPTINCLMLKPRVIFFLLVGLTLFFTACTSASDPDVAVAVALTQTAAALETEAVVTPNAPASTAAVETPTAPAEPTEAPTAAATNSPALETDPALNPLLEQAREALGIEPDDPAFDGVQALRVFTQDGHELWLVHTVGLRDFDNDRYHGMALYAPDAAGGWQLLTQITLSGDAEAENLPSVPDYLAENGVTQVEIVPDRIWLQVEGGAGAHSGIFQIYSFDGADLKLEANGFSSSPGVGEVRDINGDGVGEVLLDATDYYVFCYACGVREVATQILRWDGTALVPVELMLLDENAPADLRDLNNRAVELANAGLWKDAQITIMEAELLGDGDADSPLNWNALAIGLNAQGRQQAIGSIQGEEQIGYPLLGNIFYGDYAAAVDILRAYTPTQIFSDETPLLVGTVAESWRTELADRIDSEVGVGLDVEPDNAAGRFLRGWALWLKDAQSLDALAEITIAAELAPDDALYASAVSYLNDPEASDGASDDSASSDNASSDDESAQNAASNGGASARIYFSAQDAESGRQNIYAFSMQDDEATLIVEAAIQPQAQPNGALLAFHSTQGDLLGLNGYNLVTGERLRLSTFVEDSYPTWNPDGSEIIFASNREGDRAWRLYHTVADGAGDATVITFGQEPDWSPNGEQVVYRGCDNSGDTCGLWLIDAAGGDSQLLTDSPGDARPRWSPDGSFIIFMSDQRDDNWELYRVDVAQSIADSPITRLTNNPANDGLPAISPDGTQVAFISNRGDAWGLWLLSTQGGTAEQLSVINGQLPNWLEEGVDWAN